MTETILDKIIVLLATDSRLSIIVWLGHTMVG